MSKQREIDRLTKGLFTAEAPDWTRNSIVLHYQNPSDPGMRISYNLTAAMHKIPLENLQAIIRQAQAVYTKRIAGPIT